MPPPPTEPIGQHLARASKAVSRAFDDALAAHGGSLPVWLILLQLQGGTHRTQRELAAAVGIEGPTLTHHLSRLEATGTITRTRAPANRRVQVVELTEAGRAWFHEMLVTVVDFDARLRAGLSQRDIDAAHRLLDRMQANVVAPN
ncbi:MAG TPA: MarR family winged helix-turn-helix transcriptional regulator [Acidimicrobiales bacterium]|nr:MarR family winged helix-turn-helix transcriptional regulator [Acidimicrobiales bacterium]